MPSNINRRECLTSATALLMTARFGARDRSARADGPISRGRADVWQPIIDLHFADNSGIAQWWLPELVLLGNTDNGLRARGTIAWQQKNQRFSYEHTNPDGRLGLTATVEEIEQGWLASLTVSNRMDRAWTHVVCPVCLLLRASGAFEDKDWKRTYYRSGGKFLTYHGRPTDGGRDIYRMSLVKGRKQIERTERHEKKWGFTKQPSDDGIIAVVSFDESTVLTTTWKPTHHLQSNRMRTFSCIHANPDFGRIEAGESRTLRGCVLLIAGDLTEAWRDTEEVMAQ